MGKNVKNYNYSNLKIWHNQNKSNLYVNLGIGSKGLAEP